MKILDVKKYNLERSYSAMIELQEYNDEIALYGNFYNYLFNLFAYRESIGEKDKTSTGLKSNDIYQALKYLYNSYKHQDTDLLQLNTFVYKKSYPYKYPYTYGVSYACFNAISKELVNKQRKAEDKINIQNLYNQYLDGKTLLDVVSETYEGMFNKEKNNG